MLKKYDDSEDRNMNNKRSFSKGKKNGRGHLQKSGKNKRHNNSRNSGGFSGTIALILAIILIVAPVTTQGAEGFYRRSGEEAGNDVLLDNGGTTGEEASEEEAADDGIDGPASEEIGTQALTAETAYPDTDETAEDTDNAEVLEKTEDTEENIDSENIDPESIDSENIDTEAETETEDTADLTGADAEADSAQAADTAIEPETAVEEAPTGETAAEVQDDSSVGENDETAGIAPTEEGAAVSETASKAETAAETAPAAETAETAPAAESASEEETAAAAETASAGETASTEAAAADDPSIAAVISAAEQELSEDSAPKTENGIVRVHLAGEPGDPVPSETMDTDTASLLKLISEGLAVLDENGNPVPGCAQEWKVSDDGLKWVFRLRKDLCWADGKPMDAKDFEKMFRRIADPATEALYGHDLMKNIAGYEDVLNGDPKALQAYAKDDRTFVVKLTTPDPSFARICASWALLPVREQIEKDSPELSWGNVTGNGPYLIASENLEEADGRAGTNQKGYVLKKNPYYNNEQEPFEEVHWIVDGDVNQEYSDLLNGNFDAVSTLPQEADGSAAQDTVAAENGATAQETAAAQNDSTAQETATAENGATAQETAAARNGATAQETAAAQKGATAQETAAAQKGATAQETAAAQDGTTAQETAAAQDGATAQETAAVQNDSAARDTTTVSDSRTTPDTIGILFNCEQEALQDSRVRRALSMALDREYIASEVLGGVYEPSSDQDFYGNLLGNGESGESVEQDSGLEKDQLEEAKKLLKEAGYEDGKKFPVLVCLADENGSAVRIAEYIASRWKELGIELKIEKTRAKDLAQEKEKGLFDLICGNILLSSDLPAGELEKYTTDHKENTSGFSSEKYDGLIEEAMQTSEEPEYQKKMEKAVEVLSNETPAVPLAAKSVSWLRQAGLDGILCDTSGCWQLWKAENTNNKGVSVTDTANAEPVNETAVSEVQKNSTTETAAAVALNSNSSEAAAPTGLKKYTSQAVSAFLKIFSPKEASAAMADAAGIRTKATGDKGTAEFAPKQGSFMDRLFHSNSYYQKVDKSAWLTSQAYVLDGASPDARRIVSLPKYTGIHLTGIGKTGYVRISENGRFYYLEADKVTTNRAALNGIRNTEERQAEQLAIHSMSMHPVKERELMKRAAGIREETEEILARIAYREALKTQTRNPNWDGPVLSRGNGSVHGPSGKETYYNLNMNGVVSIMRGMGNTDEYWVRDDGCKMLGDYIMCAANLSVHPRGDIAVTW